MKLTVAIIVATQAWLAVAAPAIEPKELNKDSPQVCHHKSSSISSTSH
jgi:hypothetical protein